MHSSPALAKVCFHLWLQGYFLNCLSAWGDVFFIPTSLSFSASSCSAVKIQACGWLLGAGFAGSNPTEPAVALMSGGSHIRQGFNLYTLTKDSSSRESKPGQNKYPNQKISLCRTRAAELYIPLIIFSSRRPCGNLLLTFAYMLRTTETTCCLSSSRIISSPTVPVVPLYHDTHLFYQDFIMDLCISSKMLCGV